MDEFNVENVAVDRFNNDNDEIGSNVINVDLVEKQLTFSMPIPHQSELKKSKDTKMKLNSSMLQYIHRVEGSKRINTKATKEKKLKTYSTSHIIPQNIRQVISKYTLFLLSIKK